MSGRPAALSEFLGEFSNFADVCNRVDVAVVARRNGTYYEIVSARTTACRTQTMPAVDYVPFGDWFAARFPRRIGDWERLVTRAENGNAWARLFASQPGDMVFVEIPKSWASSGIVRDRTLLGANGAVLSAVALCGKAFATAQEHRAWSNSVAAHDEFHDVEEFVRRFRLRQPFYRNDEPAQLHLEAEFPLYFREVTSDGQRTLLHFDSPLREWSELRVKCRVGEGTRLVTIEPATDGIVAAVDGAQPKVDVSVVHRDLQIMSFQAVLPSPVSFSESTAQVRRSTKRPPSHDYSRFGTTQRTIRVSINKQIDDEKVRRIVIRDIDDALDCLDRKRFKLTAILCGGILEASLNARLSKEAPGQIAAAFRKRFPAVPVRKLEDMKLQQLVGVAAELDKLRNHKLYDNIRDWRNLVHPAAEIREGTVTRNDAEIAFRAAVDLLLQHS